ncbi:MAG: metalloregulator ArsR/SmtB family transcription factor [Protaetiibacter sp.]
MDVFVALADTTRRQIVELLAHGEQSAGEVAAQFDYTRPAISHHLKVLRQAGLVRRRVDAQRRLYSLDAAGLDELDRWTATQREFWTGHLDRLENQIRADLNAGRLPGAASTPTARTPGTQTSGKGIS